MGTYAPGRGERPSCRRLFIFAVVAGALPLAGCSTSPNSTQSGAGVPKGTTTTTKVLPAPKGTTTTTTTTKVLPGVTTIPFSLAKNARHDVATSGPCTLTGTSWILSGTVRNSSRSARNYQIVVDFVTQPGFTVLDTKIVTTAVVQPGASLPWDATGAAGKKNVACVVRQVQAPA